MNDTLKETTTQTTTPNAAPAPVSASASAPSAKLREFPVNLRFYHANSKGSGSAMQLELRPAVADHDGAIFLLLAAQKSVANLVNGARQFATFDWKNRINVKLNFSDISAMLMVFEGKRENINEGKGLYHTLKEITNVIYVERKAEPYPGVEIGISKRIKGQEGQEQRLRLLLNPVEAFGLGRVLMLTLPLIAFGIPKEPWFAEGAAKAEAEPEGETAMPF